MMAIFRPWAQQQKRDQASLALEAAKAAENRISDKTRVLDNLAEGFRTLRQDDTFTDEARQAMGFRSRRPKRKG